MAGAGRGAKTAGGEEFKEGSVQAKAMVGGRGLLKAMRVDWFTERLYKTRRMLRMLVLCMLFALIEPTNALPAHA